MPRLLYTLLLWLLVPLVPLKLLWRSIRQPEYLRHVGERFGIFSAFPEKPVIWLHCVSVGETRAAAPLVDLLRNRYPGHAILLTHATPTGRATGEQLFGDSVLRCYLPFDLPYAVHRFLAHFQPRFGLLLETELWFNLIAACKGREIPLLLVNARLSAKSARGYGRLGGLVAEGLSSLAAVAAQTEADAARLRQLGAPHVAVTGNLKFDAAPPADAAQRGEALRNIFGAARPVFLAASTREGEEAQVLDVVTRSAVPGMLTVIVPRHPQRFDAVAALLETRGLSWVRRSGLQAGATVADTVEVVLGDSMGEMPAYYSACDLAFVGGSLLPLGGQNLIEACMLGCPVLVGPHTFNFEDAARDAVERGAARRVQDAEALRLQVGALMADAEARRRMGDAGLAYAAINSGAAERTLELLEKFT